MFPRIDVSAEQRQQAYELYARRPEASLKDIERFLGVSSSTFVRMRQRWGWPARYVALNQNGLTLAETDQGGATERQKEAAASLREAAHALARTTRSQIDALLEAQRMGRATDHDKTARALASYAKTLTTAQALLEQEGSKLDDTGHFDDGDTRTIHELREELDRHLMRVIAEEEARGSDGLLL